jgi:aminoglycoside 6'-N-acetyltransferase I
MKAAFKKAVAEDRAAWAQLRSELWPHCSAERHALQIAQQDTLPGLVVLAEIGGEAIGFAEISLRSDYVEGATATPVPYLEGWYVKAAFRRQGIGRGLLSYVEAWAGSEGYTELASDAELKNDLSIRLHGQLGFAEAGRSVHFVKKLTSPDP